MTSTTIKKTEYFIPSPRCVLTATSNAILQLYVRDLQQAFCYNGKICLNANNLDVKKKFCHSKIVKIEDSGMGL